MDFLIYIFIFLIGASIGSFLNVVIDRLINDESILGRSYCDYCRKKIVWYDLIPVFSFFILKGKTRCCGKKISWQYPIVEFFTGLIFLLIYFKFNKLTSVLIYWGLISCLIVVFVSDLKYQLISDYVLLAFAIFSIIYRFIYIFTNKISIYYFEIIKQLQNEFFFSFGSSLIVSLPIFLIYFLSKEKAMGLGDVYLVAIIGFLLGWQKGFLALYIAILSGAFIGLILVILKKSKLKSKIAFGPFLVIGTVVMLFYGEKIIRVINKIYGF